MVVGLQLQQVAHLQPSLVLGGVQLGSELAWGVVQHQLVVALAAQLFAFDAAQCGGVVLPSLAVLRGTRSCAVPGGAVAACAAVDEVGLGAGAVVGAVGKRAGVSSLVLPARCGGVPPRLGRCRGWP